MSRIIFDKGSGIDFNRLSCSPDDATVLHSYEELTEKHSPEAVVYHVNEIRVANIIEIIRINRKINCSIVLCLTEIKSDYQILLEELGIKNIFYRKTNCDKCKCEIKFQNLLNDSICSLLQDKHLCIYTKKAIQIICKNGFEANMNNIAVELKISPEHLSRTFKKDTGKSFRDFYCELKYDISKRFLEEDNMQIAEISNILGYTEVTNFYRFIKRTRNEKSNWG